MNNKKQFDLLETLVEERLDAIRGGLENNSELNVIDCAFMDCASH